MTGVQTCALPISSNHSLLDELLDDLGETSRKIVVFCNVPQQLYGLESGLQRRFERHGAYEMFQELKLTFPANARIERYEVSNKFYSCKMEENTYVSEHILRMYGYHNHLTQLGVNLPDDSVIDRVLQSLLKGSI